MALFIMVAHLLPDVPNKIYLTHFSSAAVGVFFFYSGYGLYLSMETKDKYMNGFVYKRIFKKLYIPFVLVNLLYYIYNLMCGKAGNVLSIFGIGLLTDTNWYVIEILVYYVMFYIFFHRKNTSAAFWCAVAAYVLSIFVMAVWGNLCNIGLCWYISSSGFIIGMIYKRYSDKIVSILEKYKRPIFIASVAVFTVLYTVECNPELIIYRFISQSNGVLMTRLHNYIAILAAMLVIPVIILLMFLVFGKIKIGNKLLFFLGGISYQLYMIHMLCGGIVERLAAGYIDNVWAVFILKLVVSTIAAAGMKWVTDKILCKLK